MADQALAVRTDFHKTKLESFLFRKGSIVVKVIHDIGDIAGAYSSALALSTLRLFEPGNEENCTEGVRIEVKEGDRENGHISFLDRDEVDSLLKGLEYMGNCLAQSQGYRGDYTEMVFSTRGDFSVGFYLSNGKSQAFVKSGSDQAFISPQTLKQLHALIRAGLDHLAATPVVRFAD